MFVAVLAALATFAPPAEPAAQAQPAEKPKMVEVCTRVPDPGGRVPKRVCKKVPAKADGTADNAPAGGPPPAQQEGK